MTEPATTIAPGPAGLPALGSLMRYRKDPVRFSDELRAEFGDIVRFTIGPYVIHQVTAPAYLEQVLVANNRNYCRGTFYQGFKIFLGDGSLTTDGQEWRRRRRVTQPMFHPGHIDGMTDEIVAVIERQLDSWDGYVRSGEYVDVVPEYMKMSLAILGQATLGTDLADVRDELGRAVRFGLLAILRHTNTFAQFVPRTWPTPHNRRIDRAKGVIDREIHRMIELHRADPSMDSDLIGMLLAARTEDGQPAFSDLEVRDEVATVFLAGHETTGTGLAWLTHALATHPEVADRVADEVEAVLGGRRPTLADLADLTYTTAVVDEALRLYPPIWEYPRDARADDEIGGFHIPAGSAVFVPVFATHRHPDLWVRPAAFEPQRFLAGSGPAPYAYLPFGAGQRKCVGSRLAHLQMVLFLAQLCRRYRVTPHPDHPVDYGALLTLHPLHGIPVRISERRNRRSTPADGRAVPAGTS